MANHVRQLKTSEDKDGICQAMKVVASVYAYPMNRYYKRSGTLCVGRLKSSVVDTDNYLLTCYRYIELNPVSTKMVGLPEE